MFLKPYKVKSNSPLKGSEMKKLRQRISSSFPKLTEEEISKILPAKSNLSVLKVVTHSGFITNVFCVDKVVKFFEMENGVLVPTLYAIWQVPEILPYFTTLPDVLPRLANGADLMLPGVVPQGTGFKMYGRYPKMQLVAINLTSNMSATAVGYLPRSSDDLYMCGGQGVAVKPLHIFGDKLWGHDPSLVQQVPDQKPRKLTDSDFPTLGSDKRKIKEENAVEDKIIQMLTAPVEEVRTRSDVNINDVELADLRNCTESLQLSESPTEEVSDAEKEVSAGAGAEAQTEEVKSNAEELLKNAFLAALKNHGKTLQLPLLTSNFFRLYVLPEATEPLDLKKTKYKKLSVFLNEMVEQGFIVVNEQTKGVDKITSIDLGHPELVNFITDFKPPAVAADGAEESPLFHSELAEVYIVTDVTAAFFTCMDYKRGEAIPAGQIKKIVRNYISKQSLPQADPITKSIRLDEVLQSICGYAEATPNQICNSVIGKMEHSFRMCTLKDVASNKPLIQMSLATRSGNKKVTLVSNIECYGIIVPEFIRICKQGAAASTTIVKLPHQQREQLQIQGNQIRFIHNLLTQTYKVPAKCITGLELAKDGRKHKNK